MVFANFYRGSFSHGYFYIWIHVNNFSSKHKLFSGFCLKDNYYNDYGTEIKWDNYYITILKHNFSIFSLGLYDSCAKGWENQDSKILIINVCNCSSTLIDVL